MAPDAASLVRWACAVGRVAGRGPAPMLMAASALGWAATAWLSAGGAGHTGHARGGPAPGFLLAWLAMVLAMAPPLLLREVGALWRGSLRRLRAGVVASFAAGYAAVWLAAGVAVAYAASAAASPASIALAAGCVAIWQCAPARQRALNACHRRPSLRAFGAPACRDALRYGAVTGACCAATCGPLMLVALLVAEQHLVWMAGVALVVTVERYLAARRPAWRLPLVRPAAPAWPDLLAPSGRAV